MDLSITSTHLLWMKQIHTMYWRQKNVNAYRALREEEEQKYADANDGER